MKKQRKMMAPKARYLGSLEEVVEILVKWRYLGKPMTLDECSKVMGLSRSAIKAIESRAYLHARQEIEKRDGKNVSLSDYIDVTGKRQFATKIQADDD